MTLAYSFNVRSVVVGRQNHEATVHTVHTVHTASSQEAEGNGTGARLIRSCFIPSRALAWKTAWSTFRTSLPTSAHSRDLLTDMPGGLPPC